ncbi:hypothetical protein E3U43_007564 [Larimichthys crocea]|uniref:Uncharacterized protein n=1 Tax=Larimichthys crocea TaxID=215358 RepID=A0ACD3Q4R6_LARCR|nr:hypothetical protein E3U43_007564 [Larimichthys crocea]
MRTRPGMSSMMLTSTRLRTNRLQKLGLTIPALHICSCTEPQGVRETRRKSDRMKSNNRIDVGDTREKRGRKRHQSIRVEERRGDAKRKKVSSFNEDMIKADPQHLRNQRQNRSHSNERSPQLCKNFKKNPLLIILVVFGCALIVILIVVLTTVNMT